jgi:hypothetical protein
VGPDPGGLNGAPRQVHAPQTHHLVAGGLAGFFVYGLVDRTAAGMGAVVALLVVLFGSLGLMTLLGRWVFHFTTDLKFA